MGLPFVRKSHVINQADLLRSVPNVTKDSEFFLPHQSTAAKQANAMMGDGNPHIGSDNRAPGSVKCMSCGRHHKPGTVCFNLKSFHNINTTLGDALQQPGMDRPNGLQPADTTQLPESFSSFLFDKPATPETPVDFASENQKKFSESSTHMQAEQARYIDRLRQWREKYGGVL